MIRRISMILALALTGSVASADAPKDQLLANVSRDLPFYVPGVDPNTLSRHQLGTLYMIMHNNDSASERLSMIRSVLGGSYSLRGLLFK